MTPYKDSSVRILPWVGEKYGESDNVFRKHTLILGGSQYSDGYESFHTEEGRAEWQSFTNDVVHYYQDASISGRWKGTYTSFINSIFGGQSVEEQRARFFDSVVFYNYLQEIAGASANEAGNFDYGAAQHFEAFQEILEEFQPEVVISWGAKVRDALPNDWGYGPAIVGDTVIIDGKNAGLVYTYPFQNKTIRLIGVRHPSIGYSPGFHHQLFKYHNLLV